MSVVSFSMFPFSIKTNLTYVLRTMEDRNKEMLCLDRLTLELEEKIKFIVVKKQRNYTKKLNHN